MRLLVPVVAVVAAACFFMVTGVDDSSADPGWSYDAVTHSLTVTTDVPDYADSSEAPWASHIAQMEMLMVTEGVERIGSHAFEGADRLDSVTYPSTLRSIGNRAFGDCTVLKKADLSSSLETLGDGAFAGCGGLGELYVRSVISAGSGVFDDAGSSVDGMTVVYLAWKVPANLFVPSAGHSVTIHSISLAAVSEVDTEAFRGTTVSDIAIPVGVTSVGDRAFMGSGIRNVKVEGITQLGTGVFSGCAQLKTAAMTMIKTVPASSFEGCSLLSSVSFSDRISEIGDRAFMGTGLTEIVFPGTLRSVGAEAFSSCAGLQHVGFTGDLHSIGDNAFHGCASLRTVEIQNVEHLGTDIFGGCTGIERSYCPVTGLDVPATRAYTAFTAGTAGADVLIRYDFGDNGGSCVLFRETDMSSAYIDVSDGRRFDCWTDDAGNRVTDVTGIAENTVLTAQWVQADGADVTPDVAVCALSVICAVIACAVCLRRL